MGILGKVMQINLIHKLIFFIKPLPCFLYFLRVCVTDWTTIVCIIAIQYELESIHLSIFLKIANPPHFAMTS